MLWREIEMTLNQLEEYLRVLDLCGQQWSVSHDPEGVTERLEELKWILQRLYKQPLPESEGVGITEVSTLREER